jgi:hypothetical protein
VSKAAPPAQPGRQSCGCVTEIGGEAISGTSNHADASSVEFMTLHRNSYFFESARNFFYGPTTKAKTIRR